MELGHAYSVLVVSASAKFNESVRGLLSERFYWPVTVLTDAAGARRELLENSYDLVVINTPLPDEFGTRLAPGYLPAQRRRGTAAGEGRAFSRY